MSDTVDWTALEKQLVNDIATGNNQVKSYSIGDRTKTFHNLSERVEFLEYVRKRKRQERRSGFPVKYVTPC